MSRLCRVVGPSEMMPADGVGGDPMPWTRHAHGGRVRRPVSAPELIVLISLHLKSSGSRVVAVPAVVLGKPLVTVEKVDVSLGCEIGIPAPTHGPDQHLRCYKVHP